jgi:hypothetical protein
MIKLILDLPWPVSEALNPHSDALRVLRDFEQVRSALVLDLVPFIDQDEATRFWERLGERRAGGNIFRPVRQFVEHALRLGRGPHRAVPINGPYDLRESWQHALRDEIGTQDNWRTPQIVACTERRTDWSNSLEDEEVNLVLQDEGQESGCKRVIFFMRSYESREAHSHQRDYQAHKYAAADLDPWDVRHLHARTANGALDGRCKLPKPPGLNGVAFADLDGRLDHLRAKSWPHNGKYWFLPPPSWMLENANNKEDWRKGAFKKGEAPNRRGGPVDYKEQIWSWHPEEGKRTGYTVLTEEVSLGVCGWLGRWMKRED